MSEMNLTALANEPRLDDSKSPSSLHAAPSHRLDVSNSLCPTISRTASLAMIRQAFNGLVVSGERSFSSTTELRGALRRSSEGIMPAVELKPKAFREGTCSFEAVSQCEHPEEFLAAKEVQGGLAPRSGIFGVESPEFFHHLTVIGGL